MSTTKLIRWFVSGVRCKLNHQDWHMINRYNDVKNEDVNIALVWFDPKTGEGLTEAHMSAAAPEMLEALRRLDAWWTETFPGGPNGPRDFCGGLGTLSDDTIDIWRSIREAIAHAEGRH